MTNIISPRGGKGVPDCSKTKLAVWDSLPSTATYYTHHQASRDQCHFWTGLVMILTAPGRYFSMLTWYKFYGASWLPVATIMDKSSWDTFRKRPVSLNESVFNLQYSHLDPPPLFSVVTTWRCPLSFFQHWKGGQGGSAIDKKWDFWNYERTPLESVLFKGTSTFVLNGSWRCFSGFMV